MSNKTNPLENLEEELVDYVSNTPNNTNPNVVKSMVRAAADGVSTGGGGNEPLVVNITRSGPNAATFDKTFAEIKAAIAADKPIVGKQTTGPNTGTRYYLHSYGPTEMKFWSFSDNQGASGATVVIYTLTSDDTATFASVNLAAETA